MFRLNMNKSGVHDDHKKFIKSVHHDDHKNFIKSVHHDDHKNFIKSIVMMIIKILLNLSS